MQKKNRFLFLITGVIGLISCYEPKEDCLDALASNFSIDADDPCCCCCEYPPLSLALQHRYGESTFNLNDVYTNKLGQAFIPLSISFYASDLTMRIGEEWLTINDVLEIPSDGSIVSEPDDVTILSRRGFEFDVGTFVTEGQFTGIRFSIGLNEPEISTDDSDLAAGHPLVKMDNELYDADQGYLMYHIELIADTIAMDTISLTQSASPAVAIELPVEVEKVRGAELQVPLTIDYRQWFDEVDWLNDSEEVILEKIKEGIGISFSP